MSDLLVCATRAASGLGTCPRATEPMSEHVCYRAPDHPPDVHVCVCGIAWWGDQWAWVSDAIVIRPEETPDSGEAR